MRDSLTKAQPCGDSQLTGDRLRARFNPVHACRLGEGIRRIRPGRSGSRSFQHDQRAVRCQPHPVRVFDEARQLHFRQLRLWIVIAEGVELTGAEIGDCHQPVVEQHDPGGSQPAGSRQLRIPIQCTKCRFARRRRRMPPPRVSSRTPCRLRRARYRCSFPRRQRQLRLRVPSATFSA